MNFNCHNCDNIQLKHIIRTPRTSKNEPITIYLCQRCMLIALKLLFEQPNPNPNPNPTKKPPAHE